MLTDCLNSNSVDSVIPTFSHPPAPEIQGARSLVSHSMLDLCIMEEKQGFIMPSDPFVCRICAFDGLDQAHRFAAK